MRSIWKGSIAFGLVNVPVKVYSATEDHDIKFHQVHAKDNGRIRYKRVCEVCGEVVEYRDIAKAYESDDGQTVVITDEDISTLPEERSREIEVLEFVPASDIDPMMYDQQLLPGARREVVEVVCAAGQDAGGDRPGRDRALRAAQQDPACGVAGQGLQQARRDGHPDAAVARRDPRPRLPGAGQGSRDQARRAEDGGPGRRVDDRRLQPGPLSTTTTRSSCTSWSRRNSKAARRLPPRRQPKELDETEDVSDLLAKLEASVKARRGGGGSSDDGQAKKAPAKKAAAKKAPAKKAAAKKAAKKAPAKKAAKKAAAKK